MAVIDNKALLKRVPLFSVLEDYQLEMLSRAVIKKTVARNTTVIVEGDLTQTLYIILSGRCKVQRSDEEGKEVIITILGVGEFFGEMGLIDDAPRSASVIALDRCDFLTLGKPEFMECISKSADMATFMMKGLVRRLREADQKIESLALLDVYGRVARVLLDFAEDFDGVKLVRNKLPKQDIAKMVGASREMVSRVIKGLENEGFIEFRDDGVIVVRESYAPAI